MISDVLSDAVARIDNYIANDTSGYKKSGLLPKIILVREHMNKLRAELDTPELLPCPFCGGAPLVVFDADSVDQPHYIECQKCFATTAASYNGTKNAIIAWNTRTAPKSNAPDICPIYQGKTPEPHNMWWGRHLYTLESKGRCINCGKQIFACS